jgi:hypothetical protein
MKYLYQFSRMTKLLIIFILFISVCANAKTKHQSFLTGIHNVSNDSNEIEESYKIYLNDCNTIIKDTIRESGYINFDTIRVTSIPEDHIYFNKPVVKSVQISNGVANIIVADTIWNVIKAPEYRSSWDYYVLAKNPIPISNRINPDYYNKKIVFRMKVYSWKKSKPLIYKEWDQYRSTLSNHLEIY